MKHIPDHIREEILNKINILDYIGQYLQFERKGKNYFAHSPFNEERTPSFVVNPEKNNFVDYSSGLKGNVITFVMEYDKLNYPNAIKKLAEYVGIDVSNYVESDPQAQYTEELKINKFIKEYYQFSLETKVGQQAKEYLKNRGFDEETIKTFEIGFAIKEKDNELYQTLIANGFKKEYINNTKNLNEYNTNIFQNRVIIPIIENGRVLGFGGRTLDAGNSVKYINSQNSIIFSKYNVLFNYDIAKAECRKNNELFILEGFMDVISWYQHDIKNTVATMGTSLTSEHIRKLKQLSNNWYLIYDGDQAGIRGIKKAFEQIRTSNLDIEAKAVILPYGLDPDEYIKKFGKNTTLDYIKNNSMNYVEFHMSLLENEYKNNQNIDNKIKFIQGTFELIKDLRHSEIEHYLKELSKKTFTTYESIKKDFNDFLELENKQQVEIEQEQSKQANKSKKSKLTYTPKDIINKAYNNIEEILYNPIVFKDFLKIASIFPEEDLINISLIHMYQNKHGLIPTYLDTYENYKSKGIQVKKGCKTFYLLRKDKIYMINGEKKLRSKMDSKELELITTGKVIPEKINNTMSLRRYFDISDTTAESLTRESFDYNYLIKVIGNNVIKKDNPDIKIKLSENKTYYKKLENTLYYNPKRHDKANFQSLLRVASILNSKNNFEFTTLYYMLKAKYNLLQNVEFIEYQKDLTADQRIDCLKKSISNYKNIIQRLELQKDRDLSVEIGR